MNKDMTNAQVAQLFRQVAAVYQLQGKDLFHVRSYENAATSIESHGAPLRELYLSHQLKSVPGIGENFEQYLEELFRTGKIKHFQQLLKSAPEGMFPLLELPGVGPKTAFKLAITLGLNQAKTALEKLKNAIRLGKVSRVFSLKLANKLRVGLMRQRQNGDRMLLSTAFEIADDVRGYLSKFDMISSVEILGSLRRGLPTVGDIDIAVATVEPKLVLTYIRNFPHIRRLISAGEKTVSFVHVSGKQVDIKISSPKSWGDMLVHYTGSKLHNIHLRKIALMQQKSVSEFGIQVAGKKNLHENEAQVYQELGLTYIPPEMREDDGEIEAVLAGQLPKLLELAQIKGDLHVHSSENFPSSHDFGVDSVEALILMAKKLNYQYLGISDHAPKRSGLSADERLKIVKNHRNRINEIAHKVGGDLKVFVGLEVDILPSGELALEAQALSEIDYAIVSVHSGFELDESLQTARILAALANPKAKILGHPTARHLVDRPEIEANWPKVFEYCAKHHKWLEINASPTRLDLPYSLIRIAKDMGCKFVINTDAHNAQDMVLMHFGVTTARKGWLESEMVVNCQSNVPILT